MNMRELVRHLYLNFPHLIEAMEKCDHAWSRTKLNKYHEEGLVISHFHQVCTVAAMKKIGYLPRIAVVAHDLGKPISAQRNEEKEVIRFIGHEGLSNFVSQRFLVSLGLSDEEIIHVWNLVNYHTFLYQKMKEPGFEQKVADKFRGNSRLVSDLIQMNMCDFLGRWSEDVEANRDFWENAEDNLAHLVYKTQDFIEPRVTKGEAIVLIGPPLSGKSTYIDKLQKAGLASGKTYQVVCRDDVIMSLANKGMNYTEAYHSVKKEDVDAAYELTRKQAVASKENVIFDLTHMTEKSRRKSLAGVARDMKRVAVVFISSYETLMSRNEVRTKETGKHIPEKVLINMMKDFQMPTLGDDFDEIRYVINREE